MTGLAITSLDFKYPLLQGVRLFSRVKFAGYPSIQSFPSQGGKPADKSNGEAPRATPSLLWIASKYPRTRFSTLVLNASITTIGLDDGALLPGNTSKIPSATPMHLEGLANCQI